MTTITSIYNRCWRIHCCRLSRTLYWVTNCDNISISTYNCKRIFKRFTLRNRGIHWVIEAYNITTKTHHSS